MAGDFSKKVKEQLAAAEFRRKCCRHTALDMAGLTREALAAPRLSELWDKCRCDGCRAVFFRELFRLCGSVTDPAKSYQLDFAFSDGETAAFVRSCLDRAGFSFGESPRRGRTVLWLRDSGAVEDFLAFMGATAASFDVINAKIEHELRGNVNRQINFDTANIGKQLKAARKYEDAARKLREAGKYELLPEEVRVTADLRAENGQMTFEELGRLHDPPISKSGVKHRLEKLLKAAEELGEDNGQVN